MAGGDCTCPKGLGGEGLPLEGSSQVPEHLPAWKCFKLMPGHRVWPCRPLKLGEGRSVLAHPNANIFRPELNLRQPAPGRLFPQRTDRFPSLLFIECAWPHRPESGVLFVLAVSQSTPGMRAHSLSGFSVLCLLLIIDLRERNKKH